MPNGSQISLTTKNRQKYVDAYVEYELNHSIKDQYQAFAEGFRRVCNVTSDVFVRRERESEFIIFFFSENPPPQWAEGICDRLQ